MLVPAITGAEPVFGATESDAGLASFKDTLPGATTLSKHEPNWVGKLSAIDTDVKLTLPVFLSAKLNTYSGIS